MKTALLPCIMVMCAGLGSVPNTAEAEPLPRLGGGVRVWAAWGTLEELTWAYPGVDLVGTLRFGPDRRGFVDLQIGYAPIDNHTFLADGRMTQVAVIGGARLLASKALRLGAIVAREKLTFHADTDVLADYPDVDVVVPRAAVVPTLGLEASYDLRDYMALGVFGRAGLGEVTLFREGDIDPQAGGEEHRARLFFAGLFVEFRVY